MTRNEKILLVGAIGAVVYFSTRSRKGGVLGGAVDVAGNAFQSVSNAFSSAFSWIGFGNTTNGTDGITVDVRPMYGPPTPLEASGVHASGEAEVIV